MSEFAREYAFFSLWTFITPTKNLKPLNGSLFRRVEQTPFFSLEIVEDAHENKNNVCVQNKWMAVAAMDCCFALFGLIGIVYGSRQAQ